MKKVISLAMIAICFLLLPACSSNDADAVAKKIEKGDTLEQKDYGVMLDYCEKAFKEVESTLKAGKLDEKTSAELEKKYSHLDAFMEKISSGYSSFDSDNKAKFQNLMNLALAIYSGAMTAPNTPVDINMETDTTVESTEDSAAAPAAAPAK